MTQAVFPAAAGQSVPDSRAARQPFAQDFQDEWAFDVEVTEGAAPGHPPARSMPVPDSSAGIAQRRACLRHDVHALAGADWRSASDEAGHVFNEPQTPTFHVQAARARRGQATLSLEAVATDYDGNSRSCARRN